MKPVVRYYHSPDLEVDFEDYRPEDTECFGFLLQIIAGPDGGEGAESFDVFVCTPKWLDEQMGDNDIRITSHYLLVKKYNWTAITERIQGYCDTFCVGTSWGECARKLGLLGLWEFENYREERGLDMPALQKVCFLRRLAKRLFRQR